MATLVGDLIPKINRMTWLGAALIVLGLLAIVAPLVAGKATVIVVGLLLLLAGLAQLFDGVLRAEQPAGDRVLTLVLGAITTVAAVFMLIRPLLGLRILTFLLVAYLVGDGLWKLIVFFRNRQAAGAWWLLASGAVSLLVGLLIWRQWPFAGTSALGILLGANLVATGIALLALAGSLRETLRHAIFTLQTKRS